MSRRHTSILDQVRSEGFRAGLSQAVQMRYDDAYALGRADALRETANDHQKWWVFGVACGIGLSAIVGAFL